MLARLFYLLRGRYICPALQSPAPADMTLESFKIGFRDVVAIGGLIITIMVNYFSLRAEIRDLAKTLDGDRKLYELRLQLLETKVDKMTLDIERMRYDNTDKNVNYPARTNRGR